MMKANYSLTAWLRIHLRCGVLGGDQFRLHHLLQTQGNVQCNSFSCFDLIIAIYLFIIAESLLPQNWLSMKKCRNASICQMSPYRQL